MHELTRSIDQSITSLRGFSNTFSRDVNAAREQPLNTVTRVEKELLLSISILLPKLEAARELLDPALIPQSRREDCDD